jgi:hypothetical protein
MTQVLWCIMPTCGKRYLKNRFCSDFFCQNFVFCFPGSITKFIHTDHIVSIPLCFRKLPSRPLHLHYIMRTLHPKHNRKIGSFYFCYVLFLHPQIFSYSHSKMPNVFLKFTKILTMQFIASWFSQTWKIEDTSV